MKIFAYVDRSSFAESVWKHAVWVSQQLDVPIEIVHVLDQPMAVTSRDFSGHHWLDNSQAAMEERVRLDELQNRVLINEGRQLLDAVAEEVRRAGITQVSQRLYQGSLLDHLREHVGECLLAVVGKRGEGVARDSQHLGANVERLVRSGYRPVLVTPSEFVPVERATIAWDGGESSGKSINMLANRPLLHRIPTSLLHVSDHADAKPQSLEDARDHLRASGMDVSLSIRSGAVEAAILTEVKESDSQFLVIGAYGHSRIRQLIVGSTTTGILMRAETAVLVFH